MADSRSSMAGEPTAEEATFLMLKEGQAHFAGTAAELRASTDPLLRTFLSGWVPPLVA